jgi:uncharacterized membrane protein YhdT
MNTELILAAGAGDPPIMIKIIFWVLIILWAIGAFGFYDNPNWVRGSNILLILLFSILGYFTFGF